MDKDKINGLYEKLSEYFDEDALYKNVPMCLHTSFKIGGEADLMVLPKNAEEIIRIIGIAREFDVPYFVMGNGSNLLVSDDGIDGVVIKLSGKISDIEVEGTSIYAFGGAKLSLIANKALKNSLTGFEFAHGIPGTLGGAIMMNAGAYGSEMKNVVEYVDAVDESGNKIRIFADECEFGYRTSVFEKKNYIVLGAMLSLKEGNSDEIAEKMRELMEKRKEKQPLEMPSAGSTFKRPPDNFAGGLIEKAGLKGYRHKNAMVSDKHAGFVVNCGGATATEVAELIDYVRNEVNDKFGIMLEPEVKLVGRFK